MQPHALVLGASGDIGQAITHKLANTGYTLSLHYYQNEAAISHLVKQLPTNTILETISSDLRSEQGINQLLQTIAIAPTHIVFANGQSFYGLLQDTSTEMMDALFSVHVKSLWMISKAMLPTMLRHHQGNIIVISSIWGEVGASMEVIYSSVKGAQNTFVKALAKEVGANHIRVNGISPGLIDTKMNEQFSELDREILINDIPMNRMGRPEEIAELVHFLAGNHSCYINGEIIKIDGAW